MLVNVWGMHHRLVALCQIVDMTGSAIFLICFYLGIKRRLPPKIRWVLSPAYFAFWLVLMIAYYFLALPIYGETTTFVLGAITPAILILLPPRFFLSLLSAYYLVFCVLQWRLHIRGGADAYEDLFASILNGTLAVTVAILAAWYLYSARWASFQREQLLARRNKEIRLAESHLRTILENIPFRAWLKDTKGRYLVVNHQFAEAGGFSPKDIIGKLTTEINPPSKAERYLAEEAEVMRSVKCMHFEQCFIEGGVTRWYEVFKSPVLDESGIVLGTAGLARDVTARKEMEVNLATAREDALAANHAKSDFLAMMSHEIRTPMNSVLGYSELLQSTSLDKTQQDYVESILSGGRILLSIINDILDFSKIDAGGVTLEKKATNLREFAGSVVHLIKPLADKKNLSLQLEVDDAVPEWVFCDQLRIEQILINLLSNAVKFTDHGFVALRIFIESNSSESQVNPPGKLTLYFEVKDTGIGLSTTPDNLARIFQPFCQGDQATTRRFSGTGLGLVIVQRLCRLMDGDVQVQSVEGKGSIFTAVVKLDRHLSSSDPPPSQEASMADLRGLHVLVVEDNAPNRRLVATILQRWGVTADLVQSGEEALKAIRAKEYAAILMDIQMPGLDGFETARMIRQWEEGSARKKHYIIALTALAMSGDAARCFEAGMDDYLAKPIHPPNLQKALAKVRRINEDA